MIHIILLILKIIGLVLLVILGLLLFLLAILLFVPIRYRAEGERYGELNGQAKASWLLHLISITASYKKELDITVRILGFPLGKKTSREAVEKAGEELSEDEFWEGISEALSDDEDEIQQEVPTESRRGAEGTTAEENGDILHREKDEGQKVQNSPGTEDRKQHEPDVHIASSEDESSGDFPYKDKKKKGVLKKLKEKISSFFCRIKTIFRSLWSIWKNMENKAEKIRSFLTDKENQELFRLLLNQTKALCRHVFPKRLKGTIHIGFSDPYTTGQAMAAAGLLCPFYKNSIQIIPSFEEEVMEGELMCKGRIRLFNLIIIIGKLFLNKRFRYLLKKVLK